MSFHSWLQNLRSALAPRRVQRHRGQQGSPRAATHRPKLEVLEDRLTPSFGWVGDFPIVNNSPAAMVTGDFNNDGHLDLATSGGDLLLGNGDGEFVAGSPLAAWGLPTVADFNNDGNRDLAMVDRGSQVASVLLGNGDGTFRPPVQTAILPGPTDVAAADFNADGNMDLVYSADDDQLLPSSVEVLLGDGQGGFAARHQYDIRTADPGGLAVADLNADGRPDVVTANYDITANYHHEGTVSVLLGNGDGTLRYDFDSSNVVVGTYAGDVAVGDFTSDGIPDLITNGYYDVTVLPGRGDGTFAAPILTNSSDALLWLPATDFNGDGRLDFLPVYADWVGGGTTGFVFLGWGDGTFAYSDRFEVGVYATAVASGDFNGDGRPDVAVAGSDFYSQGWVQVLLNDGDWAPSLRINDVTVTEGNSGTASATFTVSLSAASTQTITVAYATGNGTAAAGSDYQAASGTLTFAPGETSKTITVLVNGDRLGEPNETFVVNLSNPTNVTISDGQGVGTIVDDEPRISISDVTKAEGKKGQTSLFTFTVTLSAAYDQPVTMSFRTVDGTAKSGEDYVARTGTITFAPGETTKTITIEVKGDNKKEANETFYLDLSGNSGNSLFAKNRGLGMILNDD